VSCIRFLQAIDNPGTPDTQTVLWEIARNDSLQPLCQRPPTHAAGPLRLGACLQSTTTYDPALPGTRPACALTSHKSREAGRVLIFEMLHGTAYASTPLNRPSERSVLLQGKVAVNVDLPFL
jgi:hypothetical protein